MFQQQSYLTTGDEDLLQDEATAAAALVTFGENKKSNCKMAKQDLPTPANNGTQEHPVICVTRFASAL